MDTMTAIRERKSYRGPYKDTPVTREDLTEILEAGIKAPSGCNLQTTSFVGVDDPGLVLKLAKISGYQWAETSKAAVVLLSRETMSPSGVSYHIHDYSAAAENIYLAATQKGLATVWVEGHIRGDRARQMGEALGIPEDLTVFVYMPLGYPAKEPEPAKKLPFEERAWFNRRGE